MEEAIKFITKYMKTTTTATIYSVPNFSLEVLLVICICGLYVLLHFEISDLTRQSQRIRVNNIIELQTLGNFCPDSTICIHHRTNLKRHESNLSLPKSNNSASRWLLLNNCGDTSVSLSDTNSLDLCQKIDRILTLTPESFTRRYKNRKRLHRKVSVKSLTGLCRDTVDHSTSLQTVKKNFEIAKENLQLAKTHTEVGKYFERNSQLMTQSLFDLLEKLIKTSSVQNPLPYKGDVSRMIFDAADMNLKPTNSSLSFDTLYSCEN